MTALAHTKDKPLVLVVDDDPDLRALARIHLGDGGFDVIQAATGQECLALATTHSPDVILLDIMMPGMNGGEVLTALAGDPVTKDIPVVFVSALASPEDKVKGLESGAVDYITKPLETREFVARVGVAARRRGRDGSDDEAPGIGNREAFEARLREEVARASRSSSSLAVLLADVDRLSEVNELHGRAAGDELLGAIGTTLGGTLRMSDSMYRYGDDEFAIILPDTDLPTAAVVAERCREAIAGAIPRRGGRGTTVSIGIAELQHGHAAEDLTARVHTAMHRAKESGGNQLWRADDPRRHGLGHSSLARQLTEREWDILVHLSHRRTEQDIARRLGIRPGTVRSHKARIRRKLHVAPDLRLTEYVRSHFKELETSPKQTVG
ncbi:MAG TPA: diguanylate cyclase [Actinomycetota bacterium]|nr:diguanylate cyclase [Actinomycetota bacterium]